MQQKLLSEQLATSVTSAVFSLYLCTMSSRSGLGHGAASPIFDLTPAINNVSLGLYNAATSEIPTGNLMVSPLSIMYCTVLVFLGAKGRTRDNLYTALDFAHASKNGAPASNDVIVNAFSRLMDDMKMSNTANNTVKISAPTTSDLPGFMRSEKGDKLQLTLANGVFVRDGLDLNADYSTTVSTKLKATVQRKDFQGNSEGVRADINRWVEQHTGGKIKDLLPAGAVNSDTQGVLANAIYFKASWLDAFNEHNTFDSKFALLNGKTSPVRMMKKKDKWAYATDSELDIQYLELPYMENEASLLIYLPKQKTGLRALERSLTAAAIASLSERATAQTVTLQLPKFRVKSRFNLKSLLAKIGVDDMFTGGADLSGMVNGGGVQISSGFHQTFIEVDEKGTEAAGASALVMIGKVSGMEPQAPLFEIDFIADHPFLYAIRHNPSKAILFLGRQESF